MPLSLGYSTLDGKYRNNETLTILAPISASFFSPLHFIFFINSLQNCQGRKIMKQVPALHLLG